MENNIGLSEVNALEKELRDKINNLEMDRLALAREIERLKSLNESLINAIENISKQFS